MGRRRFATILGLAVALIMASFVLVTGSNQATALSLEDYFSYSYQAQLSKASVSEGESFSVFVQGEAICKEDLPLSPSKAEVTSRVVAQHQMSGLGVTLNAGYSVTIQPFPAKKGERVPISQVVPLQFPKGSEPGAYQVVGQLESASVTVGPLSISVKQYLPQSQVVGTVTHVGGTSPAGSGGPAPPPVFPGTTVVTDIITPQGVFTQDIVAYSYDQAAWLTIPRGTAGLKADGTSLREITIVKFVEPPSPPVNTAVITLVYDLGPDGATFNPPIQLTLRYDPALIPKGVAQENLVIGMWDKKTGKWVELDSKVDPASRTISAKVSHFTAFTVLVHTRPAAFVTSNLKITPEQVDIGQEVTIKAVITNTGDLKGSHLVELKIDGVTVASHEVALAGQSSQEVSFTYTAKASGICRVVIGTLAGAIVVKEVAPTTTPRAPTIKPSPLILSELTISPANAIVGETVYVTVTVANVGESREDSRIILKIDDVVVQSREIALEAGGSMELTFSITAVTPGSYTLSVDYLSGQLRVIPAQPVTSLVSSPPPLALHSPEAVKWPIVAGAVSACILLVTVLWRLVRRR